MGWERRKDVVSPVKMIFQNVSTGTTRRGAQRVMWIDQVEPVDRPQTAMLAKCHGQRTPQTCLCAMHRGHPGLGLTVNKYVLAQKSQTMCWKKNPDFSESILQRV